MVYQHNNGTLVMVYTICNEILTVISGILMVINGIFMALYDDSWDYPPVDQTWLRARRKIHAGL